MSHRLFGLVLLTLVAQASLSAHRLDEYLQATRVSLGRAELLLEIDLTPGASIAAAIITRIDLDGDLTISPAEAATYGRQVLGDVTVTLDDRPVALTLTRIDVPPIDQMRDGLGQVHLRATARIDAAASSRRALFVRNAHLPESSVYLVNALVPEDRGIEVIKQVRNPRQSSSTIEYRIESRDTTRGTWVIVCLVVLAGLIAFRRRSMMPAG